MKKIIFGSLLFISAASYGQYTPMYARGYQFKYVKTDSGYVFPLRDTVNTPFKTFGSAVVRPADSSLYIYTNKWNKLSVNIGATIAQLNNKVDSVKILTDTLFYYKNGVAYGAVFSISGSYVTSAYFDPLDGYLSIGRNGIGSVTANFDGRYSFLGHTHSGLTPIGGSTGYILKKNSGTDYDYSWQAEGAGYVIVGRTLTINGTSYDLSADRSWTIPTVTYPYTSNKYLNGYGAFPSLNTDSITEGATNKFFTNARARSAISLTTTGTSGAATYNNSTGVFNIPNYSGAPSANFANTDLTATGNRLHYFLNHSLDIISGDTLYLGATSEFYQEPTRALIYAQGDSSKWAQVDVGGNEARMFAQSVVNIASVISVRPDSIELKVTNVSSGIISKISLTPTTAKIFLNNSGYKYIPLKVNGIPADSTGNIIISTHGTSVVDFSSIAAGGHNDNTITVTGALSGDIVLVEQDPNQTGILYSAYIDVANTVYLRAYNTTGSSIDPTSFTFHIQLLKQ